MTTPEVEELLVQSDEDDPRCELVYQCPDHGEEACEGRARWIAMMACPHGDGDQALVCDDCHDFLQGEGNKITVESGHTHSIVWRPL